MSLYHEGFVYNTIRMFTLPLHSLTPSLPQERPGEGLEEGPRGAPVEDQAGEARYRAPLSSRTTTVIRVRMTIE